MKNYSLPRTGLSNVEFAGELITEVKSPLFKRHQSDDRLTAQWFEVAFYRTKSRYLAHVAYRFSGKKLYNEVPHDSIIRDDDVDSVIDSLEALPVLVWVHGYPKGERFYKKQVALEEQLVADYSAMVAELRNQLAKMAPAEMVE